MPKSKMTARMSVSMAWGIYREEEWAARGGNTIARPIPFDHVGGSSYTRPIMAEESPLSRNFGRKFGSGQVIFREGDEGSEMFIIQKGRVRVTKDFGGQPLVVSVFEKGDFFGETAIVSRMRRTATVTALEAVEVLGFDRDGLLSMISKNPVIALSLIDRLCRRLQDANGKIRLLVRRNVKGLVALHLRYAFQEAADDETGIPYANTMQEMAQSIDLSAEDAKAVVEGMQEEGIVRIQGERIDLLDRGKLSRLAETAGG
jgi:CRP/FNR family transcriptional regulator, cyclic AMP receptor protein